MRMKKVVGAHHEFHDKKFVSEWADRFIPTPERVKLFDLILSELKSRISSSSCVVELGIGPGYLANHILARMPEIEYYGVDFSSPMLDIAKQRLKSYFPRVTYVQADLVKDRWWENISLPIDAVISTWSLHDLGSQENIEVVYQSCAGALKDGGVLLNGDFIKPSGTRHEYEPGRFEIEKHVEILRRTGFNAPECLALFEEEHESPTAAQNYACLRGVV